MLGGAVLIQAPMCLTQKVSWADLSTLLCSHYLKERLTEIKVHLVCMKKKKENEEFEREDAVTTYVIAAILS